MKNVFICLCIFGVIVHCFTACTDNSISTPESFPDVKETISESFSNEITTEAVGFPNIMENNDAENDANTEGTYGISTNESQSITSQKITESKAVSEDAETRFNPFATDINEYSGKEVSFVCFYFIKRYPLSYIEDGKDFSVLYGYSDGTCKAEIFTNKDYFTPFTDTDRFSFDEINEPILVISEELETLDSDTTKNINFLIQQVDFENEYIDHYPDSRNPDIEHPAVDPEYDIIDFYAADKDGNLHRILYDYVFPDRFEESGFISTQIELEDENAKQVAEILINLDVVKYWLENYAWKIGE